MKKIERFEKFIKERFNLGDWLNFLSTDQSRLSRRKLLEACIFARSSLYQNSEIKSRLFEIEAELRYLGVLKISHVAADALSDEASLLMEISEMEERLDILGRHLVFLSSSVEDVRKQLQKFGKEQDG